MNRKFLAVVAAAVVAGSLTMPAQAWWADASWESDGCLIYVQHSGAGTVERRHASTCDGADNYWAGRVRDDLAVSDGYYAKAYLDGILMAHTGSVWGRSFTFFDPDLDSMAWTCVTDGWHDAYCVWNESF